VNELPWIVEPARAIARHRGHALLLLGAPGAGVFELALRVAQTWLCESAPAPCGACPACRLFASRSHPDLRALMPERVQEQLDWTPGAAEAAQAPDVEGKARKKPSRETKVEQVRDAIEWTQTSSSRARGKVLVAFPAEAMNVHAANALLKTLEEPPAGVRLVLVAEDAELLLPTLRSRCQRIRFDGPGEAEALAWLTASGLADAPVLLAAAGALPLAARRLAEAGFDGPAWAALPRRVAAGTWQPPAGLEVPRLREVLQKLCHDAMATSAGAPPRYFPPASLPAAAPWQRLADWAVSLARLAEHDEHPFNAPLLVDRLLDEAKAVWAVGRPR
jgi:DNA polymerase-3 subunit delta'